MAGISEMQARLQQVVGPDGRIWTVRRVLLPRPPRWIKKERGPSDRERRKHRDTSDEEAFWGPRHEEHDGVSASDWWEGANVMADFASAFDTPTVWFLAIALVVIVLAFAWAFIFPVLFFLVDLLILLLIAAAGIAVRVLFRRPWVIEAKTPGPPPGRETWGVVGIRASAQAVETVAAGIRRGDPPGSMLTG